MKMRLGEHSVLTRPPRRPPSLPYIQELIAYVPIPQRDAIHAFMRYLILHMNGRSHFSRSWSSIMGTKKPPTKTPPIAPQCSVGPRRIHIIHTSGSGVSPVRTNRPTTHPPTHPSLPIDHTLNRH